MVPFTITIPPAQRNKSLPERLLAERDGILAWALQGCLEWQRTGLRAPDTVLDATDEYFEAEDALGRWIEERCDRVPSYVETTATLFASWKVGGSQRRIRRLCATVLGQPAEPKIRTRTARSPRGRSEASGCGRHSPPQTHAVLRGRRPCGAHTEHPISLR